MAFCEGLWYRIMGLMMLFECMLKVETATLISNCVSLEEFGFFNKFLIPDKVPYNRRT